MIVVDTQLPLQLTVDTDDSERARLVFERDPIWSAPQLWRSEYRNAILGYVRRGHLTLDEALACDLRAAVVLAGHEHAIDSAEVMRTSLAPGLTAYDAEFVTLARALGVMLVTFDKQILANCSDVAVHPADFVRVP